MKIYLILEEVRQDDFTDKHGEVADPSSRVVNVYTSLRTANEDAAMYRKCDMETVAKYGTEPKYYFVIERETTR